jgi:hypothetical protein
MTVRRFVCGAGPNPCGKPDARLYPMGWRCEACLPGTPVIRDLTPLDLGGPLVPRMEVAT